MLWRIPFLPIHSQHINMHLLFMFFIIDYFYLMEDSYRHKGLRNLLVEEIRSKGITDERVLKAIEKIPRHSFMDPIFVKFAYADQAFPIGAGQTISQPYTVAFQTQHLELKKSDKVLEIGTGSGYQTAVLIECGARVFTIERQKLLSDKVKDHLKDLGYVPHFSMAMALKVFQHVLHLIKL